MERIFGARWGGFRSTLVGSPELVLPTAASSVDMRNRVPWIDDQLGEQCVGESFSAGHALATSNQGKRLSHRGVWTAARARERLRSTDPLQDIGCDPQDALDGLISIGGYPVDAKDTDPAALNDPWNWAEALAAKKFSPSDFLPIATGDTDTIDRVLTAGFGVPFWIPVSNSLMNLQSGAVWTGIQPGETVLGGHAQCLIGYVQVGGQKAYISWNSWGTSWGSSGFGLLATNVIASAGAVAILGGPVL